MQLSFQETQGGEVNYEIIEALRQIAQEKNVSRDLVIETLEILNLEGEVLY